MQKSYFLYRGIAFILLFFVIQSCSMLNYINSNQEEDIVRSSKRIKEKFNYTHVLERKSPLFTAEQTVLKEISYDGKTSYTFFDILKLKSEAYQLENTIYIILNQKEIIPIDLEYQESEQSTDISSEEESIITADSTEVSVITEYTKHNRKITKLAYKIYNEDIKKIRSTDKLYFRYYSGPDMITVKMGNYDLKRLKKLIDAD